MSTPTNDLFLRACRREPVERPPVWMMRQAGRYLPEYRAVRATADFLTMCHTPELATEVTLQPVRRYGMDAAILFSDILVVPHGLGVRVAFEEGEGPKLDPIQTLDTLPTMDPDRFLAALNPVYETVARIAARLPAETSLIGFAGAPWTVATYMVEGGSSRDFSRSKNLAYSDPDGFLRLIRLLVDATIEHLSAQIKAGAEIVQLFDSWAGALSDDQFVRWSIEPIRAIVEALRRHHPDVPVIGFPRGAGANYLTFAERTRVDAVGLDASVPLGWAAQQLQPRCAVQGNLDPQLAVVGGAPMFAEAERILRALGHGPLVFNLGHGVVPQTPPDNIGALSRFVRDFRRA